MCACVTPSRHVPYMTGSQGATPRWRLLFGRVSRSSSFISFVFCRTRPPLVSIAREPVVYLNLAVVHSSAFISRRGHITCNYSIKIPVPAAVVEPPTSFYKIYLLVLNAPGTWKTLLILVVTDPEVSCRLNLGVPSPPKYPQ